MDVIHPICGGNGGSFLKAASSPVSVTGSISRPAAWQSADARWCGKLVLSGDAQRLIAAISEQARHLSIYEHLSAYAISICLWRGDQSKPCPVACTRRRARAGCLRQPPSRLLVSRAKNLVAVSEVYVEAEGCSLVRGLKTRQLLLGINTFGWISPHVCP